MKKNKIYIILFVIILILFVLGELLIPKEVDWSLSFSEDDKIPFGCYILHKEYKEIVEKENFENNNLSLYEFFDINHPLNSNFIFIDYSFQLSDIELDKILKYTKIGNDVFIAAANFSKNIQDSLSFNTKFDYFVEDSIYLKFSNRKINENHYIYKKAFDNNSFSKIDTLNTYVLGKNNSDKINFIKIKYGKGNFFINLEPLAFTNYNILKNNNYEYTFSALSYLKNKKTFWDEYYKPNKIVNSSPFVILLKNKSLKKAYYLALFGLFLYLLFMGKRQQRIIPVIQPLPNTSLEFTEIIARLYLHKKNHKDIALKRFKYLLEFLRTKFSLNISEVKTPEFVLIANRTNIKQDDLRKVFSIKDYIEKADSISEQMLFNFNSLIENIYKQIK